MSGLRQYGFLWSLAGLSAAVVVVFYLWRQAPPDLNLIGRQSLAIQVHLGAALMALLLGLVQLFGPKGHMPHRVMGWVWVGLMLVTALSSFFIRTINDGGFSYIHALSGWTMIGAPMAIVYARRRRIRQHQWTVYGLFFGGLIIAGAFAFWPGRLLCQVFFA